MFEHHMNVTKGIIRRYSVSIPGKSLFIRVVNCTLVDRGKHKINPLVKLL